MTRKTREQEQRDELLSAYLDGQLSARERARLEARLATDPALRAELEALRRTVALVRHLPAVPVPRNFILPRTVAPRPRPARPPRPHRAWAAPLLTAATALVSLLFVVVLASDLLLSGLGGIASAPAAEAPLAAPVSEEIEVEVTVEVALEEAEVEVEAEAATAAPMLAEVPPGEEPQATAEAEVPVEAEVPAEAEAPADAGVLEEVPEEAPRETEAPAPAIGGGPSEEATLPPPTAVPLGAEEPAAPAPSPTPAVEKEAAATPTATVPGVPEKETEPTPGEVAEAAPQAAVEEQPGAGEGERGVPEREVARPARFSPWRVVEVALGLTVLGLALATVWAWRARRR